MEYFQNMYHAMEEVFSAFETASLLNSHIADFRFVFGWDSENFYQLQSQIEDKLGYQDEPPQALKQVTELWSRLVARDSNHTGGRPKMKSLPLFNVAKPSQMCFRRLVLPMRACDGSILPATWDKTTPCQYGNALAKNVSATILSAFGYDDKHMKGLVPFERSNVTMIVRAGDKRGLTNKDDVVSAISEIPGVNLHVVDLAELNFSQQVDLLQQTHVLVGVHGAGLTEVMLLPPGAGVVEISVDWVPYPGRSVANIFSNLADWTQHPYRSVKTTDGNIDTTVLVDAKSVARAVKSLLQPDPSQQTQQET